MTIWSRLVREFYIPLVISAFVNSESRLELEQIFKYSSYSISLIVILCMGMLPIFLGYLCIYGEESQRKFAMSAFNTMC